MRHYRPVIITILLPFFGCSPNSSRVDSVQLRWQETRARLRGDMLLVRCDLQQPAAAFASPQTITDSPAIPNAARFTVLIRTRTSLHRVEANNPRAVTTGSAAGSGTGIVIDPNGLILTNEHVVAGSRSLEIYLPGDGWMNAEVVGTDPQSDLAVIRANRRFESAARCGDAEDVRAGEPLMALGYAAHDTAPTTLKSLNGHVTRPIQSLQNALDPTQKRCYAGMIESSIPLPRGFSGGPLLDARGRVVGINTAAADDPHSQHRKGYAIRMTPCVRSIISRLIRGETARHGYVGLWVCGDEDCIRVARVDADSPAAAADLQKGDRILKINDTRPAGAGELAEAIRSMPIEKPFTLTIERNQREILCTVTSEARG